MRNLLMSVLLVTTVSAVLAGETKAVKSCEEIRHSLMSEAKQVSLPAGDLFPPWAVIQVMNETRLYRDKYVTLTYESCPPFGPGSVLIETEKELFSRIRAKIDQDELSRKKAKQEHQDNLTKTLGL